MTTDRPGRVLLAGAMTPAAVMVADRLRRAGRGVVSCVEPAAAAFPCAGLRAGRCVLDETVDVAVLVRTRLHPRPRPSEIGVVCALRDGIPLVLAGSSALNPFERWAAATCDLDGVVAAVESTLASWPEDRRP